jgi:hypothetical protein
MSPTVGGHMGTQTSVRRERTAAGRGPAEQQMNSHTVPQKRALASANEADAVAVDNSTVHEGQIRALMTNRVKALTARDPRVFYRDRPGRTVVRRRNPTGI